MYTIGTPVRDSIPEHSCIPGQGSAEITQSQIPKSLTYEKSSPLLWELQLSSLCQAWNS